MATAGEALIDLIRGADGRFEPCIGGAVYYPNRALARQGIETLYLNSLSRDNFGRQLAAGLLDDGVHLAASEPVAEVTSLAVVSVNEAGHPDYAFYRERVADRATDAARLTQANPRQYLRAAPRLRATESRGGAIAHSQWLYREWHGHRPEIRAQSRPYHLTRSPGN